jgi:uncharacterized membrane protein
LDTNPPQGDTSHTSQIAKRIGTSVGPRSLRGRIVAGILIIIPLAVTAIVIRYVYSAALSIGIRLVYYVSKALFLLFDVGKEPKTIQPDQAAWHEITLAVVMTVLMLYLLGWLGTNVAGRRLIEFFESLLERIPIVDTLYVAVKRMVQALSGSNKGEGDAQRVVLVDFPVEGIKALGFMTNEMTDSISGKRVATVFLPTTPNPTSGYMLVVPVERLTPTDWKMEEALSMVLSGGASAPKNMTIERASSSGDLPARG